MGNGGCRHWAADMSYQSTHHSVSLNEPLASESPVLIVVISCQLLKKRHKGESREDRNNVVRWSCLTLSKNTVHQVCSWPKFIPSLVYKSHRGKCITVLSCSSLHYFLHPMTCSGVSERQQR